MPTHLEVLFSPAEFERLPQRDLRQTVCVVFDILRATSTIVTALANGASAIVPVAEIDEALAVRKDNPNVLLAGERNGFRITADLARGVDFDLGNSPREFTSERVQGRIVVMTTTNGTRALRACVGARTVLIGSFLGLRAVADWILARAPERLLLVCSGTHEEAAYEDALGAGALADLIWTAYERGARADSAIMAREIYRVACNHLIEAVGNARNGRRLLAIPELAEDVAYVLRRDTISVVAALAKDGAIRLIPTPR